MATDSFAGPRVVSTRVYIAPCIWVGEAERIGTDSDYVAMFLMLLQMEVRIRACDSDEELGQLGDGMETRAGEAAERVKIRIVNCSRDNQCKELIPLVLAE